MGSTYQSLPLSIGGRPFAIQGWHTPISGIDASGNPVMLRLGSNGSLTGAPNTVAANSPSRFQNLGANATLNVKATPGNVFSLTCYNANAAAQYVQLHNTDTVPSTGVTVPIYCFLVPPASQIIVGTDFFTNNGVNFATGIAFAFSTTRDVYTAATAGDQSTRILYA